jgi:hypothetical protein
VKRHRPIQRGYRSPRKLQRDEDERRFSAILRDRGWCEAAGLTYDGEAVCSVRWPHAGSDPHHVWPEDRDRGVHDPARGKFLCRAAHDWVHANPRRAKTLGLLRPDVRTDPGGAMLPGHEHRS